MTRRLGAETESFLTAFSAPADGLRVNTLRLSPEEFERISPFPLRRLKFPDGTYVLSPSGARPGRHPFHAAGLYYLQDPSAAVAGALVDARPGERVLDLAAAPGGKTTQLAAGMRNTGLLVANDVARPRAIELAGNLERCGVRNAMVTNEHPTRLGRRFGGFFDRVLVDAPCSGESMFPRSTAALADWSPGVVLGCARRQAQLLEDAADLVRPGGVLVYSTCTFSEEENEDVAGAFLESHPEFETVRLVEVEGAESVAVGRADGFSGRPRHSMDRDERRPPGGGFPDDALASHEAMAIAPSSAGEQYTSRNARRPPEEISSAQLNAAADSGAAAYRLWPHRLAGAGHFVFAVRRRSESAADHGAKPAGSRVWRTPVRPESRNLLRNFLTEVYSSLVVEEEALFEAGEDLFALPAEAPEPSGLRCLRPGVWLGTVRRGRFEPAHALVMALPASLASNRLDLALDDPRVGFYLTGHPLSAPGEPGWIPVCVEGYALGWGKRVGATVKNHYPKGLRWK